MVCPPPPPPPPLSPVSSLLQGIGLSRDDLSRASEAMRMRLSQENAPALSASSSTDDSTDPAAAAAASRARSTTNAPEPSRPCTPAVPVPQTPVKAEPVDAPLPLRAMASMDEVLDRKTRARQEKRQRRQRTQSLAHPPSPSPASALPPKIDRRVSVSNASRPASTQPVEPPRAVEPPPITPTSTRYYRLENLTTPTNARQAATMGPSPYYRPETYITPKRHNLLPASSPAFGSSPASSPTRPIVNLVSSPGPMGPPPSSAESFQSLPYTLPPGPYPTSKPELSYAALIGQAILCSPGHKLTLQEIYEWITTVYPFYQRNEQTWMNSVRHVLSTTACFRKAPRERERGKTQWAIWDQDIKCFENGGFDKRYCSDIIDKRPPGKRRAQGEGESSGGRRKRTKKTNEPMLVPATFAPQPPMMYTPAQAPVFPVQGGTHHQTYMQACQKPNAAVVPGPLFPPLPSSYVNPHGSKAEARSPSPDIQLEYPPSPAVASPPSAIPELTADCGSSSSPTSVPPSSAGSVLGTETSPPMSPVIASGGEEDDERVPAFNIARRRSPMLGKGKCIDKGKGRAVSLLPGPSMPESPTMMGRGHPMKPLFPPLPESPTSARSFPLRPLSAPESPTPRGTGGMMMMNPVTPPPAASRPMMTPPPSTPHKDGMLRYLNLSPERTPLSHMGLHMSPSPSLAHFKTHLEPPPPAWDLGEDAAFRTPSRGSGSAGGSGGARPLFGVFGGAPVTPRALVFPAQAHTPLRSGMYDPHDPAFLLEDEIRTSGLGLAKYAFGGALQDSPAGLYGANARRAGVYQSPDVPSPDASSWRRY